MNQLIRISAPRREYFNISDWQQHCCLSCLQNFASTVSKKRGIAGVRISLTSRREFKFVFCCKAKVHINSWMQIIKFDWQDNSGYSPTIPRPAVTKISLVKICHGNGKNRRNSCQKTQTLLLLARRASENITLLNPVHCNETGTKVL